MKAQTVKDVLVAAKWILTHYGWNQHDMMLNTAGQEIDYSVYIKDGTQKLGSCCLIGALHLVECEFDVYSRTRQVVKQVATPSIPTWNDQPERTKEQVLALLDQLIAEA